MGMVSPISASGLIFLASSKAISSWGSDTSSTAVLMVYTLTSPEAGSSFTEIILAGPRRYPFCTRTQGRLL